MKRKVKIVALVLSHVGLFFMGAAAFAGHRTQAQFALAEQDPLFRVGTALGQSQTDKMASASLDQDLALLSRTQGAPTSDVIRLAAFLHLGRLDEARVACTSLGWHSCDTQTLMDMRKQVLP